MLRWVGYYGDKNPDDIPKENPPEPKKFRCPHALYERDLLIKRVSEWAFAGDFDKAENCLHANPAKFYRFVAWLKVESAAQPIRDDYDEFQRDAKGRLDKNARRK